MNISSVSQNVYMAPTQHAATAASMTRVKDNDGDYDNGTGADDAVKAKTANGSGLDIKA